jgi:hypothetical protein
VADVQVLIDQAGPLPITVSADIEGDGPAVLTLAGSVWSGTANAMIGVSLSIDGQPAEISANIFSNGPTTHRAVVPVTVPYTFSIGSHTFELEAMTPQTTSDSNDRFVLTVQY